MFHYVYMIKAIKRYYCKKEIIYYTGQTKNLIRRFLQHLNGTRNGYLNSQNSRKILVYVDYADNLWEALKKEKKIKRLAQKRKVNLINSDQNQLVRYIPIKAIILKKKNKPEEQIALTFVKRSII